MLRGHASDPGVDDLPQLQQAHLGEREEVSFLWRLAARTLRILAGTAAPAGWTSRSDRADRHRLHRALRRVAGDPARSHPPDERAVLDSVARITRALAARNDRRCCVEPGLVLDAPHRHLSPRLAAPHLLQRDVDSKR